MKINTITPIANPSFELGFASASTIQLDAKNGQVDHSAGLWPYEVSIQQIGIGEIYRQYKSFIDDIASTLQSTIVNKIIFVGIESILIDYIVENYGNIYKIIMIPNAQQVDVERIKMNYDNKNVVIANPFNACEWVSSNTLIVTMIFRFEDDTLHTYSYSRRFLGNDIIKYCCRLFAIEVLPVIQGLDFRTPPHSPEIRELAPIEPEYFNKILTFKN